MIRLQASELFQRTYQSTARVIVHRGGSSSSKTWSILQYLITYALERPRAVITVIRATMPALKKSAMRDLQEILKTSGLWEQVQHWRTTSIFEFPNGSVIEFVASDDESKFRGPRRDVAYIDEANELSYDMFKQINLRTRDKVILSFNPSDENVWINKEIEQKRAVSKGDVKVIQSSYLDNPFLSEQEINEIEFLRPRFDKNGHQVSGDDSFWRVFGLGEYGHVSGRVFDNWYVVDSLPESIEYWDVGVDFGFVQSPTAIVLVGKEGQNIYLKELHYGRGMSARNIADVIAPTGLIAYCDSADPRTISDLRGYGIEARNSIKGKSSVLNGIQLMKQFKIHVTSDSLNLLNEYRKYRWELKNDKYINQPVDAYNHAIDGARYVIYSKYRDQNTFLIN